MALDGDVFIALFPDNGPISFGRNPRRGTDDFEHPFGRILFRIYGMRPVSLKVRGQCFGVLANLAEIDSASTPGEQQKSVEALKQNGRGLMNGAQNGLAIIGEFVDERADGPGGLTVETRGRFVEEEEQVGFGGKLHPNR